jgi:rhodanese-related sulfurtransferase
VKSFMQLVAESLRNVEELMPWDLDEALQASSAVVLLDIREPYEFEAMHIAGSINVPRGILESACEYDYEETEPTLAEARREDIVVICRSGLCAASWPLTSCRRWASRASSHSKPVCVDRAIMTRNWWIKIAILSMRTRLSITSLPGYGPSN